jgi:hypothetical protein
MRCALAVCALIIAAGLGLSQQARPDVIPPRYGIDADLVTYPQATPKDDLRSVLKAIDARRIDYMLAHLADPEFVDQRVKDLGGRFENLVRVTTENLADDPESVRDLRRYLSDGDWQEGGDAASVGHKDIKGRQAFFRKIGTRWFLENRRKPAK